MLACPYCDLVQVDVPLKPKASARCRRCGAVLERGVGDNIERAMSFALAGLPLFFIANVNQLLVLDFNGQQASATLIGAVVRLQSEGMGLIAALVVFTTMICPFLQLVAICYVSWPLRAGVVPRGFPQMMRILHWVEPWGMLEVFVLGSLVSLAKLSSIATVIPGVGMWGFGALILVAAGAAATFESDALWKRADQIAGRRQTPQAHAAPGS